jgi:hypothetical protein
MHKPQIVGVAAVLCTLVAAPSNMARADPPESMAYVEPKMPFVICDTRDQIMQVLNSVKEHKLNEKLAEFAKAAAPNREPACVYGVIGPVLFGASEHVGLVFDSERGINMWVSHVGNRHGEFYLLWGEVGKETPV